MDDFENDSRQIFLTPIGEFTINSYEIPTGYKLHTPPVIISNSDNVYKIVTIDQSIQIGEEKYTPVLHQNCMEPDQKTIYPLTITQHHDNQIVLQDHYHSRTLDLSKLPAIQIRPWYPVIHKKGCIPCTNCGRCGW